MIVEIDSIEVNHPWKYLINAEYTITLTNGTILELWGNFDHIKKLVPGVVCIKYQKYPPGLYLEEVQLIQKKSEQK